MFLFLFFLVGCTSPAIKDQKTIFMTFKAPSVGYADTGFLYKYQDFIKLQMYANANPVVSLKISKESICMSFFECMSKEEFNKQVLSNYYPKDILEDIIMQRELFNGEHMIKKRNGFTQNIAKEGRYDIRYEVLNGASIFHDTINNITIRVEYL
ncbi:MAG: hypothetical protein JXQ68_00655 [Campylobacterales bacterium]|nr:hypothetical protein [Campylobacterales bacterium]